MHCMWAHHSVFEMNIHSFLKENITFRNNAEWICFQTPFKPPIKEDVLELWRIMQIGEQWCVQFFCYALCSILLSSRSHWTHLFHVFEQMQLSLILSNLKYMYKMLSVIYGQIQNQFFFLFCCLELQRNLVIIDSHNNNASPIAEGLLWRVEKKVYEKLSVSLWKLRSPLKASCFFSSPMNDE